MSIKAVLTGHSRGLGAALAEALTARGVAVLGVSRRLDAGLAARCGGLLRQTALDLADLPAVLAWAADQTRDDAPAGFLAGADVALLINNAGVVQPIGPVGGGPEGSGPEGSGGAEDVARAVVVNVAAPLALTDAFVAVTAVGSAAADRRALHISSGAGRTPYAGWSVYCATKAALDQHARAAALDAVPGLRIASLAPGVVDTDMQGEIRAVDPARFPLRDRFRAMKDDGGLASPRDAAARIVDYLLSADFAADPTPDVRRL